MYKESCNSEMNRLVKELSRRPDAIAQVSGRGSHSRISGKVSFFTTRQGTLVAANIQGLPETSEAYRSPVFGFHIHGGDRCSGNAADPFADAGAHYNPDFCDHPFHAGDMPPLFGNNGIALSVFLTDRFVVKEVVGKTVIIHSGADDFTTQPGGNAGSKIACGMIRLC